MKRRILFLLRRPPYGSALAQEMLDAMLVAGVFEQDVSVLFCGDGVYQLLDTQQGDLIGTRDIGKALTALPAYDVEQIYVAADALGARGLVADDLVLPVRILEAADVRSLLARQDVVISG
jgi:tRNA 2-thiouridine synthesizing protein C